MKAVKGSKHRPAQNSPADRISPEKALEFLDSMRMLQAGVDEATKPISIRVPANILRAFKAIAEQEDRSYQALMNQALREFLLKRSR